MKLQISLEYRFEPEELDVILEGFEQADDADKKNIILAYIKTNLASSMLEEADKEFNNGYVELLARRTDGKLLAVCRVCIIRGHKIRRKRKK